MRSTFSQSDSFSNRTNTGPVGRVQWDLKLKVLVCLVLVLFFGLGTRLFYLQVIRGDEYTLASMEGIVKKQNLIAPRGEIRDSRGRILAKNTPNYCLYAIPSKVQKTRSLDKICSHAQLSPTDCQAIASKILAVPPEKKENEILLLERITHDQIALLESNASALPGFHIKVQTSRIYIAETGHNPEQAGIDPCNRGRKETESYGEYIHNQPDICHFSHILGYVNQPNSTEVDAGYSPESLVGRSGIERGFEEQLRGKNGFEKHISVPGQNKKLDLLFLKMLEDQMIEGEKKQDSIPGNNVILTLDSTFQKAIYEAISNPGFPAASAAVIEVGTGRILALVSRPGYNTNLRQEVIWEKAMLENPYQPLKDKALREIYFPASTFKLVTAVSAFEQREKNLFQFDPDQQIFCHGSYEMRGKRFGDHEHGLVNFHQALVRSCNVYFFQMAEQLGLDTIAETAKGFGIGLPLNLHMGESKGIMPTKQYYLEEHPDHQYLPGQALNAAIGQGEVKATLLHMAMAYEAFANGGTLHQAWLVDRVETPKGELVFENKPTSRGQVHISADTHERIMRAFFQVVHSQKGTAHKALIGTKKEKTIELSGKTGTAQLGKNLKNSHQDHSWFIGFTPAKKPEVVVAIFVEHGGHGGETAAPMAYKVAQRYWSWKQAQQKKGSK